MCKLFKRKWELNPHPPECELSTIASFYKRQNTSAREN